MDNVKNSFQLLSEEECKYNKRDKYYINSNGELIHLETMVCKYHIFNPDGLELSDFSKRSIAVDRWNKELDEMYGYSGNVPLLCRENPVERSKRRAKKNISDYILCNEFDLFCTLTLNPELINNKDYQTVIKKLNVYLDNRVRRNGLKYVGVPELHKSGGLHFHFLCNSEAVKLVDSGTVSCKGRKKPIKVSTADKYGIPLDERQTVYNIPDWKLGFTTAIKTYGEPAQLANYVGKYITKGDNKIGGRWYYSGGNLKKPFYEYSVFAYDDVTDFDYEYNAPCGDIKVVTYGTKS